MAGEVVDNTPKLLPPREGADKWGGGGKPYSPEDCPVTGGNGPYTPSGADL